MAATLKNDFWKQRSKHGRDMIFASPTVLWEAACEYFEWATENPLIEIENKVIVAAVVKVEIPHPRPFTMIGLTHFCDVNEVYFNQLEGRLAKEESERAKDFTNIINKIRAVVYNQKFEGAAVGFFKENLIARDLGLKDKTDLTSNDKTVSAGPDFSKLTFEQLEQLTKGNSESGGD